MTKGSISLSSVDAEQKNQTEEQLHEMKCQQKSRHRYRESDVDIN